MKFILFSLLTVLVFPASNCAQVPVFDVDHAASTIKFDVKASVEIAGVFDKWESRITFSSPELASAVLDIRIQAASVDTGSGLKNGKLKGKDFFDAKHNPVITFHSTKAIQAGPDTIEFDGDFTIRGVTKSEKLLFKVTGAGTGEGEVDGTMAFDRKEYGMHSGIPFIKIADRVEVTLVLKEKRVSGPPVVLSKS